MPSPKLKPRRAAFPSIVVGVGNPFMRDDGVGIVIARELEKRNLGKDVLVLQRQMLDISLLLLSEDASRLIVVDAVRSGKRPGTLVRFRATGRGSPSLKVPLSHGMQVSDLVKLAKKNRISLCPISVVGVEPAVCTIGENLTKAVRDAVPAAVEAVLEELGRTVEEPAD